MPDGKKKTTENAPGGFLISVVVPVFNEQDAIERFYAAIQPVLLALTEHYELLFIDDGSGDASYEAIRTLAGKDKRVKAIRLSRNFGKEAALTAGLDHVTGDVVFPMDVDLQDPPELLGEMLEEWKKGYHMVLATRRSRDEESLFKRLTANVFYRLLHRASNIHIPADTGDFRLLDKRAVEAVRCLRERTRFMKGIFAWPGFKTSTIYYDRPARSGGESRQSYRKLLHLAADGLISFSTLPLKIWIYIGFIISALAFVYALMIVFKTLILGVDVPGYASMMTTVLFIGGIQLVSLGVLGEYIARIYREVKQRPLYVIEDAMGVKHD